MSKGPSKGGDDECPGAASAECCHLALAPPDQDPTRPRDLQLWKRSGMPGRMPRGPAPPPVAVDLVIQQDLHRLVVGEQGSVQAWGR